MAGALLEIRKKITGVKNTRKITKAMQLVAASKMRQFQKRAVGMRQYVWGLLDILDNILQVDERKDPNNPYTEKRNMGKTLFVLYTSDKGLCGPLNNKLISALFRSPEWKNLPKEERELVTIGKKSHEYAKSNKIEVLKHYVHVPEKLSVLDALKIVEDLIAWWNEGKIKEIYFVAPHYKNAFTFYPVLKKFLPFSKETLESTFGVLEEHERPKRKTLTSLHMIFEPSQEIVLDRLHEQLIQSLFMQSFLELKASEYSSRMLAMQNATDSADRIVNDLTRDYNKARQAVITNEIAELIGASASIN